MSVYIVLFTLVCCLAICNIVWRKDRGYTILSCILFSILAFRAIDVAPDTINYVNYFINPALGYGSDDRDFEWLFQLYNQILRAIWTNGSFFVFVNTIFTLVPVLVLYKKCSANHTIAYTVFICHLSFIYYMSALRQCLSISFFLLAFYCLFVLYAEKKEKKYLAYMSIGLICAVLMHTTSLVAAILLIVIYFLKISSRKTVLATLIVSFVIALFQLIKPTELFTFVFSNSIGYNAIERYSIYEESLAEQTTYSILKLLLPITFLTTYMVYNCKKQSVLNNCFVKSTILFVVLYNLLINAMFAYRMLFPIGVMTGIGLSVLYQNQKNKKIASIIFILFTIIESYICVNDMAGIDLYNYHTFLTQ